MQFQPRYLDQRYSNFVQINASRPYDAGRDGHALILKTRGTAAYNSAAFNPFLILFLPQAAAAAFDPSKADWTAIEGDKSLFSPGSPGILAADEWLPLVSQPPLFDWDESQRWQISRDARLSQATGEEDIGRVPMIPGLVSDEDLSHWTDTKPAGADDEPWHTFFLIPSPPPTRGWDEWDWNRDFSPLFAKPPENEPFDFALPIVTPLAFEDGEGARDCNEKRFWMEGDALLGVPILPGTGWLGEFPPAIAGNSGSLAAMVALDDFVNAPAGSAQFGPAPTGRSARFGFSISSFR